MSKPFSTLLSRASAAIALAALVCLGTGAAASAAPNTIDFGVHDLGTAGHVESLTVFNDDPELLVMAPTTVRGVDADMFDIESDGCAGTVLATGDECDISVRFVPRRVPTQTHPTPPAASAELVLQESGSTDAVVLLLEGKVMRPASLSFARPTMLPAPFDAVPARREGETRRFWFFGGGDHPVHVGQVSLGGPGAAHFRIGEDICSLRMLKIGSGCYYEVLFRPLQAGKHEATITMAGMDPSTTVPIVGIARPTVRMSLGTLGRHWARRVTETRLRRALKKRSLALGAYSMPITGTLEVVVRLGRGRRRGPVVAIGDFDVVARKRGRVVVVPTRRAARALRTATRRTRVSLELRLHESSGTRTAVRRSAPLR
jgi:hypothetical protein